MKDNPRKLLIGLVFILYCLLLPGQVFAQSFSGPTSEQFLEEVIDRNDDEFATFGWPAKGHFPKLSTHAQAYVDFNRNLWNDYGLAYGITPTIMLQQSTRSGSNNFTANEQVNGLLVWRPLNKSRYGTGLLLFNILHVGQLTNTTGLDMSLDLGVNYFVSDSIADVDIIKSLLWQHELPGETVTLKLGHGGVSEVVNGCRYACDDTASFLSSPLSAFPASTMPGQGTMFSASVKVMENAAVEVAAGDALGNGKLNFKRVFNNDELAYTGAIKFDNPFAETGDGQYRFGLYQVDATGQGTASAQAETRGYSINVDQDFGDLGLFAKYARNAGRSGRIKQTAAAGGVWTRPFGYAEDWLGLGVAWAEPTASGSRDEYVAETYYRLQLTPFLDLTPAVMLVMNPSNKINDDIEGVFTLRLRAKF